MNRKNILALALGIGMVATLCLPLFASAQTSTVTVSSLQAQIAALLKQLEALRQGQHDQGGSSSTPPTWPTPPGHEPSSTPMMPGSSTCMTFPRNLSIGSEGSDVSDLQTMLAQDPSVYPDGQVTGHFGPLTAKAVIRFQEKNDIASSSAGFFGPLTRTFFMKHCGPMPTPPGGPSSSTPSSTFPHPPFPPMDGSSTRPSGTPPRPMPEHTGSSTFPPLPWPLDGSSTHSSGTPPLPPPPPHPVPPTTTFYHY